MMDWWLYIQQDLILILAGMDSKDLTYPIACLCLMLMFVLPLPGIDRSDLISGLMYVAYCIFVGTTMFFAVPEVGDDLTAFGLHIAFVCLVGAAAAYRWFRIHEQAAAVVNTKIAKRTLTNPQTELPHEKL